MTESEKRELLNLIERGDRYGLMLAAVRNWSEDGHPTASHTAVYVYHDGDVPPVRITVPVSSSVPVVG